MPHSPQPLRRALRPAVTARRTTRCGARLALALAMVAQLLAGVVIPLLHARMPATLGAHVERQGRPTHAAHDDAGCATCAVQHLADRVERPAPAPPFAREPERPDPARAASMVPARVAFAKSPRAPPLPV